MDELSLARPIEIPARPARRSWQIERLGERLRPAAVVGVLLVLAVVTRVVGLDVTHTSDEGYWMRRTLDFGAALMRADFGATYRVGHPGVTVMWTGLLGIGPELRSFTAYGHVRHAGHADLQMARRYPEAFDRARLATALVTASLMVLAVALAWRLLGAGPALVGGGLLLFDAYVVGMTRLLHVDALLAPLMTVSVLAGLIYWLRDGGRPYLVVSGMAGGLALLTKAPAALLPIFFAILALNTASGAARRLGALALWAGAAALTYAALWPALWTDPIGRLRQVALFALAIGGGPHNWPNFFLGEPMTRDPGSLYYPVALAFRLGPPVLLGLLALGLWLRRRPSGSAPVLWLVGYAVLFLVLMSVGGKKFDRYALPAIMALDLVAGVGLWALASALRRPAPRVAALAVPVALQAILLWQSYPYPIAAYNPLLGGAVGARQALMIGWGEGLDQVAAYLNAHPRAEQLVVSTHYHLALRPRLRGTTVRPGSPAPLDYFVVYVNMAQRELISPSIRRIMASEPPEFTAHVHGVEYAWLYRVGSVVEPMPESDAGSEE